MLAPLSSSRHACLGIALTAAVSLGCNRQKPDFGTLPRVIVPFGETASEPAEAQAIPQPSKDAPVKPQDEEQVSVDAADPPPLVTKEQIDFVFKFDKGAISVLSFERKMLALKTPTDRRVGRFAFELFIGSTLLERVRFDFPLLGAGTPQEEDALEGGLTTQTNVRIPWSERANRARILDRKTRNSVEIVWPPEASPTE
jgi:hypothetical protein